MNTQLNAQLNEYELKGLFLERFTRFIDWPSERDTIEPFIIGVIGDNPFNKILDEMYAEQKIKNREVKIIYLQNVERIMECHLLFISETDNENLKYIISTIKNRPILSVSDTPGYAEEGVHINFYPKDGSLGFEINLNEAKNSGLRFSHLLLDAAVIIDRDE